MSGVLGILTRKMSWILSEILESPIRSHVTMGTYMVASRLAFPLYLRIPLAFVSGKMAPRLVREFGASALEKARDTGSVLLQCAVAGSSRALQLVVGSTSGVKMGEGEDGLVEVDVDREALSLLQEELLDEDGVVFHRRPCVLENWFPSSAEGQAGAQHPAGSSGVVMEQEQEQEQEQGQQGDGEGMDADAIMQVELNSLWDGTGLVPMGPAPSAPLWSEVENSPPPQAQAQGQPQPQPQPLPPPSVLWYSIDGELGERQAQPPPPQQPSPPPPPPPPPQQAEFRSKPPAPRDVDENSLV